MTMPARIQLKRSKGWRMPANTVIVARPSKWGNPFKVGTAAERVEKFRSRLLSQPVDLGPLHDKNLACWCRLDQPCHADVLLELAKIVL